MLLQVADCWARLSQAQHGVLATVHQGRGVDAVPVVFALYGFQIVLPIDTLKGKRHTRLTRLDNIRRDPRCVLLVDEYREDWSQLWWVRVHARAEEAPVTDELVACLATRYQAYGQPGALASAMLLVPELVTGWRA
jgi:PPOX class probable F420-dependent enzyme